MGHPRGQHLLLLFALLCLMSIHVTSLFFNYNFSIPGSINIANLMYFNDSYNAGGSISLTKMTDGSVGRVAHAQPIRLWDCCSSKGASFTTSFTFAIGDNHTTSGGMAWHSSLEHPPPPPAYCGNQGLGSLVSTATKPLRAWCRSWAWSSIHSQTRV
ncbi:hypothetical protein ACP4OV_029758 [Aristida adscensionis]